jgi:release factor-specific protein-(glutamine-N5) methyltransferase
MPAEQVWTVKAALDWTREFLAGKGDDQPRRSAEWLLSAATGLSRLELYAFHDRPLTPEERADLREGVKRRAAGEPLQYVTGEMPFRHLCVRVRRGVLIPRPETEVLVDVALDGLPVAAFVVDLCTGSGCVALSIAQERPDVRIVAVDLSPAAAVLAAENAARLGLAERLAVAEGDLFAPLPDDLRGRVDLVVANPPYIPTGAMPDLPEEVVGFEPHLALDGGLDGLDVARRILADAADWLGEGGRVVLELDERNIAVAAAEAAGAYEEVAVHPDLSGRSRVLSARVPGCA